MLNIVDLPTPFGPSNPQISPSLIVREILSRICLLLKDKEMFLTFKPEEAPLYAGDSVFNWRSTASGQGVDHMLEPGGPAHMKTIVSVAPDGGAFKATLHDGNTSNKVGKAVLKLNADRTLHSRHTSKYIAVYKKVKVV